MKFRLNNIFPAFLFLFITSLPLLTVNAQEINIADSLKLLIKNSRHDTARISNMMKLAEVIYYDLPDSSLAIYKKARMMSEKIIQSTKPGTEVNNQIIIAAKKHLAFSLYNLGYIHDDFGENDKALDFYKRSYNAFLDLSKNSDKDVSHYGKQGMANVYNDLGYLYRHLGDFDKALNYYNKSLIINKDIKEYKEIATLYNNMGVVYRSKGDMSAALDYSLKSLEIAEKIEDNEEIAYALNSAAYIYDNQGDLAKALEFYNRSLKIYEKMDNKYGQAILYNNIAIVYFNQNDIHKSIEYSQKAAAVFETAGEKKSMSITINNIGAAYEKLNEIEKAREQYLLSMKICEESGYKQGLVTALGNLGLLYEKEGDFVKAYEYFKRSVEISEEIGDKHGIMTSLTNLGNVYFDLGKSDMALELAKRANGLSIELGYPSGIKSTSSLLKKIYNKQGNYKKALEYYEIEIKMRDSISNEENFKQTMKQQAHYEYEKKAATDSLAHIKAIEIKNLEVAKIEEEKQKQKVIMIAFILGFIVILFFSVVVFRLFVQKKKANIILAEQKKFIEMQNDNLQQANEEITAQRDEIEAQRDEIAAQRDLVTEQKEHIEEQKKEITDSITYAKRIQNAVLPDLSLSFGNQLSVTGNQCSVEESVDNPSTPLNTDYRSLITDYFVLFKPKDIVSGDFYWATRIENMLIFTVADCTGHGVPGAFMSMLGVSFLNEIVRKKEISKAGQVLDYLRNSIVDALKQKGISGEQKDGMDIVFCVLDLKTNLLQFSGANNSLYIIKKNSNEAPLIEIKADSQPVAIHVNMAKFTTHEIQLEKGDCLYLTTDGFPDQFGGPKNKKFMIKRLKEVFVTISENPMKEQCEVLNSAFEEWRGNYEQIDDVTIMGIKI